MLQGVWRGGTEQGGEEAPTPMDSAAHLAAGSWRLLQSHRHRQGAGLAPATSSFPTSAPVFVTPAPGTLAAPPAAALSPAGLAELLGLAPHPGPLSHTPGEQSPPSRGSSAGPTLPPRWWYPEEPGTDFSTKLALPRGASPLAHLLLDSQRLFRSQSDEELLQRTRLDRFNLHLGVAAGRRAKGVSPAEQGTAGWDGCQVCPGQQHDRGSIQPDPRAGPHLLPTAARGAGEGAKPCGPPQPQHRTDATCSDGSGAGEGHMLGRPPRHAPTSHPPSPGRQPSPVSLTSVTRLFLRSLLLCLSPGDPR